MRAAALVPLLPLFPRSSRLRVDAQLDEARALVRAAGFACAGARAWPLRRVAARSFLGSGACARLARLLARARIQFLFVDAALTSGQQTELEAQLKVQVCDRTGLILRIFAARAQSREGRLQVALARCHYQLGRLTRHWTHLERQRAGSGRGFLAGPGETQLEADRRQLCVRVRRLDAALARVETRRSLQRRRQQQRAWPLVALVGYTNAGKSTLFQRLADEGEDAPQRAAAQVFATLDPCVRRVRLPGGRTIVLSDTVGFIANLPPELIAAFRSSLEHVRAASLIVHVRDLANPDQRAQAREVTEVLRRLGADEVPILDVFNKQDVCPPAEVDDTRLMISAARGTGLDALRAALAEQLAETDRAYELVLPLTDGAALAWLKARGCVRQQQPAEQELRLRVRLSARHYGQFCKKFLPSMPAPAAERPAPAAERPAPAAKRKELLRAPD